MPDRTLDYDGEAVQVVAGSAWRAFKAMGGSLAIVMAVVATGLWVFARDPVKVKVGVTLAMFGVVVVVATAVSIVARFTFARVQNGRLTFSFCGVRTRTIPLDSTATFEIRHRIGRMRVLVISSGRKSYVPNGALDRDALVELLRLNGVVENV